MYEICPPAVYAHETVMANPAYLAEIRKHSRDVPVSLSTENFGMWAAMKDSLECNAMNYVCGCGPRSVPGLRKLDYHPFHVAVRHDQGSIPGVAVR